MNNLSYSMALISVNGATGSQNMRQPRNDSEEQFGFKTKGENGSMRYHEFKDKLKIVFTFNKELGSIFSCGNTKEYSEFVDELYLSYLVVFRANPFGSEKTEEFHRLLFDASNHFKWFKKFVLNPNRHPSNDGHFRFPASLGAKPIAETWLNM